MTAFYTEGEKILLVNETNHPTRSFLIKRGSSDFFGKIIG